MNKIERAVYAKENAMMKFRPSNNFYLDIGINKKRFWQLVRGEKSATIEELEIIATQLGVEITELI